MTCVFICSAVTKFSTIKEDAADDCMLPVQNVLCWFNHFVKLRYVGLDKEKNMTGV